MYLYLVDLPEVSVIILLFPRELQEIHAIKQNNVYMIEKRKIGSQTTFFIFCVVGISGKKTQKNGFCIFLYLYNG